jgi:uncharacterized protein (TIGR00295 family)
MKYPSEKEAMRILRKYNVPQNVIEHCEEVKDIAVKIAKQIMKGGHKVDLELVKAAALLHDVGSYKYSKERGYSDDFHRSLHAPEGQFLLEKLGYKKFAKIVGAHFLPDVSRKEAKKLGWPEKNYKLPNIIEAKIVSMADRLVTKTSVRGGRTLEKYISYLRHHEKPNKRYFNRCPELREKTIRKVKKIWKELERLGMRIDELK